MKCPNILKPSVAVAVAVGYFALFLAPCCLGAAIDSASGLPQELLVPFNDLLPPLSDVEVGKAQTVPKTTKNAITSTITTPKPTEAPSTTTTTARAPATSAPPKPTKAATAQQLKKTQYQLVQQQQQYQQQQQQKQPSVAELNLNPEVPPPLVGAKAPIASVKVPQPKPAATTQHFQHVQAAQTQYQALQQHLQPQKVQLQKQQFAKQLLQAPQIQHKLQPQAAAAKNTKVPSAPRQAQQQTNNEHLQQYLEYIYHTTTRRPSRGALPTLTPFPRRFK